MNKFGLELVLKAHEEQIKTKGDKLVAILHWCLLHRGLRCSGKGENFAEETGGLSELLPLNWTQDQNVYALKYRQESNHPNKFIFKGKSSLMLSLRIEQFTYMSISKTFSDERW